MQKTTIKKYRLEIISITILIIVPLIIYFHGASIPSLFGDEWARVNEIIINKVPCPRSYNLFLRPFWGCHILLLNKLFGLNIIAFHFASLFFLILESILFYLVLNKLFPNWKLFSLLTALLFSVYPSAFSHLWFESLYAQLSMVLLLASIYLFIEFYTKQKIYIYILGIIFLIFSIILYESNIGLILFLSLLAFFYFWKYKNEYKFTVLIPTIIAVFYSIGRLISQFIEKTPFGHSVESINNNIPNLFHNYLSFIRFEFQWAWTHALKRLFLYDELSFRTVVISVFISIFLFFLFVLILKKFIPDKNNVQYLMPNSWKILFILAIISLLLTIAGYFPIIIAYDQNTSYIASHSNILPNLGASLFVITCLSSFVLIFKLSPFRENILAVVLFVIIVFFASYTQIIYQKIVENAWNMQKEFWSDLFILAPDFKENTKLIVIIDDYPYKDAPNPFMSSPWGFSGALSLLYEKRSIQGYFTYEFNKWFIPDKNGFIYIGYKNFIPYDSIVLMRYNYPTRNLSLVKNNKYCFGCILPKNTTRMQYRYLLDN